LATVTVGSGGGSTAGAVFSHPARPRAMAVTSQATVGVRATILVTFCVPLLFPALPQCRLVFDDIKPGTPVQRFRGLALIRRAGVPLVQRRPERRRRRRPSRAVEGPHLPRQASCPREGDSLGAVTRLSCRRDGGAAARRKPFAGLCPRGPTMPCWPRYERRAGRHGHRAAFCVQGYCKGQRQGL